MTLRAPWPYDFSAAAEMTPDIHVWAECPCCGAVWLCALVTPGAWWAPADPRACLAVPYCVVCECAPPMLDATRRTTQGQLFGA